ncbi:MAG: type II toxin-antitoxin system RatA family toxin [Rhodospirillales bacterium]|nr:type II toxin-antitoxin system RatA family toxin [Rhodospirillales bacterium]MBO6786647.1 type II toxin-antitoxin system RatA family toxin [Rhodospirillales bacterium]
MPTHAEKRVLPYTKDQLFDLVIDVERYPEFLPWCLGCRVRKREEGLVVADMIIGFKVFRESFTSRVSHQRPDRIDVTYTDGPFKYLNNHWIFNDLGNGSTEIDFYVDFEFRSRILQAAIGAVFNEAVKKMIAAFEGRANQLHG